MVATAQQEKEDARAKLPLLKGLDEIQSDIAISEADGKSETMKLDEEEDVDSTLFGEEAVTPEKRSKSPDSTKWGSKH